MKLIKSLRYVKNGNVVIEIERYECRDGDFFIRNRKYCSQMGELVVTDFRKGTSDELRGVWTAWQNEALTVGELLHI